MGGIAAALVFMIPAFWLFWIQFLIKRRWQWRLAWGLNGLATVWLFAWLVLVALGYDEVGLPNRSVEHRIIQFGSFGGLMLLLPFCLGTVVATFANRLFVAAIRWVFPPKP
jgi:hypothetical protein